MADLAKEKTLYHQRVAACKAAIGASGEDRAVVKELLSGRRYIAALERVQAAHEASIERLQRDLASMCYMSPPVWDDETARLTADCGRYLELGDACSDEARSACKWLLTHLAAIGVVPPANEQP